MSEREFSYTQEVDKEEIMFFMEDEIITQARSSLL